MTAPMSVTTSRRGLERLMERVSHAQARARLLRIRPDMAGVLLEAGRAHLRAVATDGCRLVWATVPALGDGVAQALVPWDAVRTLRRCLREARTTHLTLTLAPAALRVQQLEATRPEQTIDLPLPPELFPAYRRIIRPPPHHVRLGHQALVGALARIEARLVVLDIGPQTLTLRWDLAGRWAGHEVVRLAESCGCGSRIWIAVQRRYLVDALRAMPPSASRLLIEHGDAEHPVWLRPAWGSDTPLDEAPEAAAIMPYRVGTYDVSTRWLR